MVPEERWIENKIWLFLVTFSCFSLLELFVVLVVLLVYATVVGLYLVSKRVETVL